MIAGSRAKPRARPDTDTDVRLTKPARTTIVRGNPTAIKCFLPIMVIHRYFSSVRAYSKTVTRQALKITNGTSASGHKFSRRPIVPNGFCCAFKQLILLSILFIHSLISPLSLFELDLSHQMRGVSLKRVSRYSSTCSHDFNEEI